jgi:fermentation-respiration switch protein FrsA (DUF1100 family)
MSTTPGRWRAILAILFLRDVPFWQSSQRRRIGRVGAFGCYTYLGVLVVLLALENRFLYPGASRETWFNPPVDLNVRDVELTSASSGTVHAWWVTPPAWSPERGAILYSHGNGGNLSGRSSNLRRWRKELDRAVLVYDYPGYGKSSGQPSEAGCYEAGDAAYRWLVEEQKVPAKEVILMGSSLGGAIATDLAARHESRMLILCSTFTSFPDMAQKKFPWLPSRWLVTNKLNTVAKIDKVNCPVLITHGTADPLIPFWMGQRLFEVARKPKRFLELTGHPHAHPHQPMFYEAVRAFLKETERPVETGRLDARP